MRRGSPLPIPNREVKPACADGTAVMWESMSSPFFSEPQLEKVGVLFFIGATLWGIALDSSPLPAGRQVCFMEPQLEKVGVLFFIGATLSGIALDSSPLPVGRFALWNPIHLFG